jgi:hypothetical protein
VVAAGAGRTWTDLELPGRYDEITLASAEGASGALHLPLAHGITPAGLLTIGHAQASTPSALPETATPAGAEVDSPPDPGQPDVPTPADPVAEPPVLRKDLPEAEQPDGPEERAEKGGDASDAGDTAGSSLYGRLFGTTVDRDALLAELTEGEAGDEVEDDTGGATEDAPADAPADTEEGAAPIASGHTAIWQPETGPAEPAAEQAPAPVPVAEPPVDLAAADPPAAPAPTPDGLIDGVPWAAGSTSAVSAPPPPEPVPVVVAPTFLAPTPPPPAPPAPPPAAAPAAPEAVPATSPAATAASSNGDSETEVRTVNRAELLKALATPAATGPTVMAVRCPRSHLTSAYSAQCRICGDAIDEQVPNEVPRPTLGRLVLSTGETVILDRDVILGRAPESTEEDPAVRPNLVRLTDSGEVSRMHVRVTLDGWQPLLRDLGSSNGTTLTLSSSSPQQLRPQEDYLLEPGCEVSLADVVSFRFDVTE